MVKSIILFLFAFASLFAQSQCRFDSIHFDEESVFIKYNSQNCSSKEYPLKYDEDSSMFFVFDGVKCLFNPKNPYKVDLELVNYFKRNFVFPKKWNPIPHILVVAILQDSKGNIINYGYSKKTQDLNYDEKISMIFENFDFKQKGNQKGCKKTIYTLRLCPIDLDEFR